MTRRRLRVLAVLVFVLAATPMVGHLVTRGALWADEAALALNIGPRSLLEMGRPFVFYQACPWGTMALVKLSVTLGGGSEVAYRLVSCLAAVATLPLMLALGGHTAGRLWTARAAPAAAVTALALVGASSDVVYYAAELKPYTVDMLVAAALLALYVHATRGGRPSPRALGGLAVAGVFAGWLSLPSIFVTGSITAALLWEGRQKRGPARALLAVAGCGALWLLSFSVHFGLFIGGSDLATKDVVHDYWRNAFAPFPPTSAQDLRWYAGKFLYLFDSPLDVGVPALGAGLFLFGGFVLVRRAPGLAIALFGPWALALVASMLGRYPPEGRLAMFLVPPVAATIAAALGRGFADARTPVRLATGLALALLLVVGLPRLADYVQPGPKRDMRALLVDLSRRHEGEAPVFLSDWDFEQIWRFYADPLDLPRGVHFRLRWLRKRDAAGAFPKLDALADRTFGRPRVWVIAHDTPPGYDPNAPDRSATPMATFIDRFYLAHGGRRLEARPYGDLWLRSYDLSAAAR